MTDKLGRAWRATEPFKKMKNINSDDHRLPATGLVLAFIVDCLGVSKEAAGYSYKDLQRLRKGGLATEKCWEVVRKVMDSIVGSFLGETAAGKIEETLKQKFAAPMRRILWREQKGVLVPVPEFCAPEEAIYWKCDVDGELADWRMRRDRCAHGLRATVLPGKRR